MYNYTLVEKIEISNKFRYRITLDNEMGMTFIDSPEELSEEELNSEVNDLCIGMLCNANYISFAEDLLNNINRLDIDGNQISE
tara:strand:+ start:390 stop:638 length:249 start_codon:yes stop_codon:yes gene_type:complete